MQRDELIERIRSKVQASEEWGPEDAEAFYGAVAQFESERPDLINSPVWWDRLCRIDDQLRSQGDSRPYLMRWRDCARRIDGAEDPNEKLLAAMDSGDPAIVHLLRTGQLPHPEQSQEAPEGSDYGETIGVMASSRASVQVARAGAEVTARAMGLKKE